MNGGVPGREAIEATQLQQLRRLLAAMKGNRFYAPKLSAAGLCENVGSLAAFTDAMPLTTKAQVVADQAAHPPWGTNHSYPLEQYSRYHATSGTTGRPLRWLDTDQSWQWMVDNWKAVFEAAGAHSGDRVMFAFSFGPFLGFWTAFDAATQMHLLTLPGGGLSSTARLDLMRSAGATVLCCTPTYAIRLGEVAAERGAEGTVPTLRRIIVAGEPGGSIPSVRDRIEAAWKGASVFDHHGMTEVGPVTYQCPHHPGTLRILETAYLAEVIEIDGTAPVQPGEPGELVLTTLGRLGSPLLRYRTGDLVRAAFREADGCGDGAHMVLEGGILGRVDDMVVVRGVNVYPSAIDRIVRDHAGIAEYRVQVDRRGPLTELSVQIEPGHGQSDPASLAERLTADFREQLALRVGVETVETGVLPRFEMKARRWVVHEA